MQLICFGLNHKTAPVAVREQFAIPKSAVRQGLANLGDYDGVNEAVVLSTCNRSEIYAVVESAADDLASLKQFFFDLAGNEEDIDAYLYTYMDEDCVRHEGRHALIFGAGKMAELTAQHLVAHGISLIYVANRHMERAAELAARFGGEAIPFEGALRHSLDADVIVTSTGAPHYVVKAWETQQFMTQRRGRPGFFIDIAVPRDVEPEVGDLRGVTLYNIDALEAVVDEHRAERREEAKAADAIIEEEVASLEDRFRYLSLRPLMALLSDRCERIREREMRRWHSKIGELDKEHWRHIDHMTQMIVRKILRMPMIKLRKSAGTEHEQFYIDAMRALFKLDTLGGTGTSEMRHHHYRHEEQ